MPVNVQSFIKRKLSLQFQSFRWLPTWSDRLYLNCLWDVRQRVYSPADT